MNEKKSLRAAVDDTILAKDHASTAGSKILENFVPPFDATVISRMKSAGIEIVEYTKPNEFGTGMMGAFEAVSSVAMGKTELGVTSDVLGVVRRQAAQSGCFFIKPTYGSVSRFGLVSTSPSMEQIGIAFRNPKEGAFALSAIAGLDERDGMMHAQKEYRYEAGQESVCGLRVGVLASDKVDANVKARLKTLNLQIEEVDLPLLEMVPAVSYIIAAAEMSNSISRFDGIKFGYRTENYSNLEELYLNTRTEGLSFETKVMTLTGMLVLTKDHYEGYFDKALRARRLIKEQMDTVFQKYDLVLLPSGMENRKEDCGPEDFQKAYGDLAYTALANLTGHPAMAVPAKMGAQLMAKAFDENVLFKIALAMGKED